MNILIIGPIPPTYGGPSFGGIATHIEGLAVSLETNGHSIHLWYHKPQKANCINKINIIKNSLKDYTFSIFTVVGILLKNDFRFLNLKQRMLLGFQISRLKKILKLNIYDCVHIHSMHNTSSLAFQYINEQNRPPIILTDHGFWQDPLAMKPGTKTFKKLKLTVELCDKIIYISNYAKQKHDLIDLGQDRKLVKISNPIIISDKIHRSKGTTNKKIIFFNGLTESLKIKRLDVLLKAIQENDILRNKIQVIALANNEAHEYVSRNEYGFEIDLYHPMPWAEVKKLYFKSDLFVLPSKSESFGLVYLEALSLGLPIIGFEDIFDEFQASFTEYIGEPFNSNEETSIQLGNKIEKVINTPFNYTNVYNSLKKEYGWENNICFYEKIYKAAAN